MVLLVRVIAIALCLAIAAPAAAQYRGDYAIGSTVEFSFTTVIYSISTGVPTPTTLAGTPVVKAYKNADTIESTAGITLTADHDGRTGLNHVTIDTSADGTFYSTGSTIAMVITTGTLSAVSIAGTVIGEFTLERTVTDVRKINGSLTNGNNATLSLKQLNISNSAGTAVVAASAGSNGHGIDASGNGTGSGLRSTGGGTGHGFLLIGGATSGTGLRAAATAGNNAGINGAGSGNFPGLLVTGGPTGHGIDAYGGVTSGAAIGAYGLAGNSPGIEVIATGTGSGIYAQGGATGHGIEAAGGLTSGDGIQGYAVGNGRGISGFGAATGTGLYAQGGATNADGLTAVKSGAGVPIRGDITGNLSGSVGSVTGAVGSLTAVSAGAITSGSFAANSITASAVAADAATEIANAVWATVLESNGSYTAQQIQEVVLAILAGRTSTAAGVTTFKTPNNAATRAVITITGGDRSAVTLSP